MDLGDLIWKALLLYVAVVAAAGAMVAIYLGIAPDLSPSRMIGWGAVGLFVMLVIVVFTWFLVSGVRSNRPA